MWLPRVLTLFLVKFKRVFSIYGFSINPVVPILLSFIFLYLVISLSIFINNVSCSRTCVRHATLFIYSCACSCVSLLVKTRGMSLEPLELTFYVSDLILLHFLGATKTIRRMLCRCLVVDFS